MPRTATRTRPIATGRSSTRGWRSTTTCSARRTRWSTWRSGDGPAWCPMCSATTPGRSSPTSSGWWTRSPSDRPRNVRSRSRNGIRSRPRWTIRRATSCIRRTSTFGRECALHLAPEAHGSVVLVDRDIGPAQRLPRGDRSLQLHAVREAERQSARAQRILRGHELAEHGVAPLAVERVALGKVSLCRRDDVGVPGARHSGRLATQSHRRDADAELEADQVIRLVHRRVTAAVVGEQTVLAEAALHVRAFATKRDVHAPAQVAEHRLSVALEARHDLHLAGVVERSTIRARSQYARQVVDAAGREREPVGAGNKPVAFATAAISIADLVP